MSMFVSVMQVATIGLKSGRLWFSSVGSIAHSLERASEPNGSRASFLWVACAVLKHLTWSGTFIGIYGFIAQ
jgi:hypothetical protein